MYILVFSCNEKDNYFWRPLAVSESEATLEELREELLAKNEWCPKVDNPEGCCFVQSLEREVGEWI